MTINLHLPAHVGSRLALLGKALAFVAAGVGLLILTPLRAQTTLYWDINGATAGSSGNTLAAGTWDESTNNLWSLSSDGTAATQLWSATAGDKIAVFSAGTNATGAFTVTVNGTVNNVAGITFEEGAVTLGGAGTLTLTGTPSVNVAAPSATISAVLTGTVGFSKAGAGTLTLSGANTYTGATNINAGILSVQSAGALGTAANTGNTTVASGATLQLAGGITTTNSGTLVLNGTGTGSGALQNVSGNNTWNGSIALASNATVFSATAGNILYIDDNYVSAQTLALGNHTLTVDGPGDTWFNANAGVVGDTGGLIKNGTGQLTLYGYNTYYTGATVVNAGSIELVVGPFSPGWYGINGPLTIGAGSSNPALAGTVKVDIWTNSYANQISPTSAVTINSDGVLNVGVSTGLGSLTLNGGQVNITNGQTVTASGDLTSNANSAHQTSLISGGTLNLATGNINVARDSTLASDLTISSAIGGTNLAKTGNGILTLSGANNYTGATNINAGTLRLGASNVIPDASAVTIQSGATLNLHSYSETIGGLSGAGTVQLGSGTLTVGSGDVSSTFSGSFASGDTGTFAKTGTGTLTLGSALNLSSGTMVLNGGTLILGPGTSTFGALSVTANSIIDFGAGNSILNILGLNSVAIAAGVTLTIQNWTDAVDYFYSLVNPGAANLGRIVFSGFAAASTKWQPYDHQITPVPESSVYGAVLLGLSALFATWRLNRRRTS
jgi:fibronectin-binding autotransporter adhesin